MRVMASPEHVEDAKNATRQLIEGDHIALRPAASHKAVEGHVTLRGLGSHVLQLAGLVKALGAASRVAARL